MPLRKNLHLLFGVFLLVGMLSACAYMPEERTEKGADNARFNNLLEMHDLSERAFAYHQHCLKSSEPINETFMDNFKITSDLLLDEAIHKMNMSPEMLVERVLNRRRGIQQKLSEYYHSVGCQSEEGRMASPHYKAFGQMSEKQVKALFKA